MAPAKEPDKDNGNSGRTRTDSEELEPPAVKEMKALDDQYLDIEREYEREVNELRKKYAERRKPLLEQRAKILRGEGDDQKTGTPAVKGFWLEALGNHPAFEGAIEEWDAPVLEYMQDITQLPLDPDDSHKGFKIRFEFAPNPYFEEAVLSKEYHTKEKSPYTGEIAATQIVASDITWKAGKDVTVEVVKKKAKGGGAKKEKQKAKGGKGEPRNSFFRLFFKNLREDGPIPDDVDLEAMGVGDEDDDADEEVMEMIMDNDHDMGCAIRDNVIPYAVRWYTGEAAPEMDDDDEEDEEEDEDGDEEEDDEEDEDEDENPRKGFINKKGGAGSKKKGGGGSGGGDAGAADRAGKSAAAAGGEGAKQEDCKQQ